MADRRIVGVDPGKTGAIAFLMPDRDPMILKIYDVPTLTRTNSKGRVFKSVDVHKLGDIAAEIGPVDFAVHEKVGARPGEAPAYAFDFGFTSGLLVGALIRAGEVHRVAPAIWKARLNVSAVKAEAIERASELFPDHKHLWPLKKHDGRAEAAMLALYGARHVVLD